MDLVTNPQRTLKLLQDGQFAERTQGHLPWSSNYVYLMNVYDAGLEAQVIYKPQRGEQPLWDFPDGSLCLREQAAFLVSEALGWHIVPPTVLRDGPLGFGSVQLRIEAYPDANYFTFGAEQRPQLRRLALFDHIVNNADRKGGHCLLAKDERMWSIDHGICFHRQSKLRTVIWDFAGQPVLSDLLQASQSLCEKLSPGTELFKALSELISHYELDALRQRIEKLVEAGHYPRPGPGRNPLRP